ncbi:hypothetical protein BD289DRAFT_444509 [Coniella lustricola]|uniref:Uncharacterized protein n=1 Tax=Coniella lustricola TaxID=2025994 RepID=A0A2T2ZVU2_9PEZI|nr:hypothetical protein BD289DRAFT_444509 [Coniella lustricola]
MGAQQPYMYAAAASYGDDGRFPFKPFDPKAVTRASYDYQPPKPKHEGPLLSFNRHPDSHVVPEPRKHFKALGPRTKAGITWLRIASLALRVLQTIAAAGVLFLFVIIDDVSALTAWILRITAGVNMLHCAYGIFHLARPAGARPPASSASYQVFSAVTDLAVLPLYVYGCLSVRTSSDHWGTLLPNESLMNYFLPSLYYTLLAGSVMHLVTLANAVWLAVRFRQITRLPPDMNPLEDNLTSRHRKKLSVATTATDYSERDRRLSGAAYDDPLNHPPSIPFHSTRSSPRNSLASIDPPPRHYQITPHQSPRNSISSFAAADANKRFSAPPSTPFSGPAPAPPPRSPWRNSRSSYTGLPAQDAADLRPPPHQTGLYQTPPSPQSPRSSYNHYSRPSSSRAGAAAVAASQQPSSPPREPRFTESWQTSESLFGRTHDINSRARKANSTGAAAYEALINNQRRFDLSDSESDYGDDDNDDRNDKMRPSQEEMMMLNDRHNGHDDGDLASRRMTHPNPLRANPLLPGLDTTNDVDIGKTKAPIRTNTRFIPQMATSTVLSNISLGDKRVNGGATNTSTNTTNEIESPKRNAANRNTWAPRNRDSSIQGEADFCAKPYGDLKSATPPLMLQVVGSDRQVSSGSDLGAGRLAAGRDFSFSRRNVSGKLAEEGRVATMGIGRAC